MSGNYTLLVNSFANGGRAARRVDVATNAIKRIGAVDVQHTKRPGDEPRIVQHAIDSGSKALFVLGGDGTISHATRAIVAAGSSLPVAILGAGTGNDFAKALGAPVHDYEAITSLAADNAVRTIDAGRVDDYVFINSAGFGFDARVQQRTKQPSRLSGNAVYIKAALGELFSYRGFDARVQHGETAYNGHWLMLVFANGGFFGGTFNIAPDARIDDGTLDCVAINDASALSRARLFAGAMRGAHVTNPKVRVTRAPRFTLSFNEPPAFQADGELRMARSANVEVAVVPNAVRIVAP